MSIYELVGGGNAQPLDRSSNVVAPHQQTQIQKLYDAQGRTGVTEQHPRQYYRLVRMRGVF